ncbi:hypothetical protein GDO86_001277 [Hymenochirus boettgeri]|uniref:Uncharacterized protein n=1 Tax=Hymenochirus boettgeri TaxID=247094 RepID=A0A8T2KF58_9PIPI|nr:hypothetical protein GDO86_001277 [Hymenochirus boettgeri]
MVLFHEMLRNRTTSMRLASIGTTLRPIHIYIYKRLIMNFLPTLRAHYHNNSSSPHLQGKPGKEQGAKIITKCSPLQRKYTACIYILIIQE